jgi:SAM-dependent methyltransferase
MPTADIPSLTGHDPESAAEVVRARWGLGERPIANVGRGYPLVQADLERLPFGNGILDGAFGRHSYLHLPRERLTAALAETSRVLRPGGLLMITLIEGTYAGHALPGDDLPGRYFGCWTEPDLIGTLSAAGYADIRIVRAERRYGSPDLQATARSRASRCPPG